MELITGDLSVIEEECNLLINELYRNNNLSEKIAIISSLNLLSELYYDVTGLTNKKLEKYKKNKNLCQKALKKRKIQSKQFIDNFIENKEFHNLVNNDILHEINDKIDKLTSIENGVIISSQEMYEIMHEFLSKKNMTCYLDDVISKKRIFYGNSSEFCTGYMCYNVLHKVPHILIDKDMNSVEMMMTIVHEVGHIQDSLELSKIVDFKTLNDYSMKSIYVEVISKQREKEFLDFLLENNIASKDVCCMVEDYYLDIKYHLESLLILTSLDDKLLRREKYRGLSVDKIIDSIEKNDILEIDEDFFKPQTLDLFDSLSYSYGGILATYFNDLEINDIEKYEFYYKDFLSKRADWFKIENFISFVSDCEKLPEIIGRKIDKDIKIKQKIYHEN